jgi:hypothetical protein
MVHVGFSGIKTEKNMVIKKTESGKMSFVGFGGTGFGCSGSGGGMGSMTLHRTHHVRDGATPDAVDYRVGEHPASTAATSTPFGRPCSSGPRGTRIQRTTRI